MNSEITKVVKDPKVLSDRLEEEKQTCRAMKSKYGNAVFVKEQLECIIEKQNKRIYSKDEQNVATLCRLIRYEGFDKIAEEVIQYAIDVGMFMKEIDSKYIGVKSVVQDYTNKQKKTFKAHYTVYGHYIRKMETGEEDGIYYQGNFLFKTYEAQFRTYLCENIDEPPTCLQDFFAFE
jgi:hypothetical protein